MEAEVVDMVQIVTAAKKASEQNTLDKQFDSLTVLRCALDNNFKC